MSATRRIDNDEFSRATAVAREIRERVADQLHDLTVERVSLGSQEELVEKVRAIGRIGQEIGQARARQLQAAELGLPLAKSVADEQEARALMRSAVMSLGASCGALTVAMDFEDRRSELRAQENGRRVNGADGEHI